MGSEQQLYEPHIQKVRELIVTACKFDHARAKKVIVNIWHVRNSLVGLTFFDMMGSTEADKDTKKFVKWIKASKAKLDEHFLDEEQNTQKQIFTTASSKSTSSSEEITFDGTIGKSFRIFLMEEDPELLSNRLQSMNLVQLMQLNRIMNLGFPMTSKNGVRSTIKKVYMS